MKGKELKAFRKSLGMTQKEFAKEYCGSDRLRTVTEYETDYQPIPQYLINRIRSEENYRQKLEAQTN